MAAARLWWGREPPEAAQEEDLCFHAEPWEPPVDAAAPAPNPGGAGEDSDNEGRDEQLAEKLVLSYLVRELDSEKQEQPEAASSGLDDNPAESWWEPQLQADEVAPVVEDRALLEDECTEAFAETAESTAGLDVGGEGAGEAENPAEMVQPEGRELGVVEKFAPKRGFGFIAPDSGGELLFAHWTQICSHDKWPQLTHGMRVEFTRGCEKGRPAATLITTPGGGVVVAQQELEKGQRRTSPFTLTGTVAWFHKAGYGFIRLDTEMEWPQRIRAGRQIYVSREDLIVEEGFPCCLEAGQRVQFKVYKPPDKDVAATEVTALGGAPLACRPAAAVVATQCAPASDAAGGADWSSRLQELASKRARDLASDWDLSQERPLKLRRLHAQPVEGRVSWLDVLASNSSTGTDLDTMSQCQRRPPVIPSRFKDEMEEFPAQRAAPRVRKFFGQGDQEMVQDMHRVLTERAPELPLLETSGASSVACKFFAQGRCKRGSECPFSHRADLALQLAQQAPSELPTRKVPCRFFAQGRCQKGEACPFAHQLGDQEAVPIEQKVPVECEYYARGLCTRGAACRFAHGPQERFEVEAAQLISRPGHAAGPRGVDATSPRFPPDPPLTI